MMNTSLLIAIVEERSGYRLQEKDRGSIDDLPSMEIMKGELRPYASEKSWIPEVRIALNGLVKEIESGMIELNIVPGFIGPDEFYA